MLKLSAEIVPEAVMFVTGSCVPKTVQAEMEKVKILTIIMTKSDL
jgi:hypothetical protein